MIPRRLLTPLLLMSMAASTAPVRAEPAGTIGDEYVYDSWQREDGLPQISVNAVVQDRSGYLWVGTKDGLARFDGSLFTVFDRRNTPRLPSGAIRALLPDRDGSLWIATRRGLVRRAADRFDLYTTGDGLAHDKVRALHQDREGHLWIGTDGGLSHFMPASSLPTQPTKG